MSPELVPGLIDDVSFDETLRSLLTNHSSVVVGGNEADLLALRLVDHGQMSEAGFLTYFLLMQVTHRKQAFLENRVGDGRQKVGLILVPVDATGETGPVRLLDDARIVTGGDVLRAELAGEIVEDIKLDPLVAAGTGIGRATITILIDEVVDNPTEAFGVVEGVKGDIQAVRHPAGIDGIFHRAARLALLGGVAAFAEAQERTNDFVTLSLEHLGSHAGIDSTAHRHQNLGHRDLLQNEH